MLQYYGAYYSHLNLNRMEKCNYYLSILSLEVNCLKKNVLKKLLPL